MTDEVAALVLRDNYFQKQALVGQRGARRRGCSTSRRATCGTSSARASSTGALEFLPDDEELAERRTAKRGLTAPEAAVLLAYSKMELYDLLLASDVPGGPDDRDRDRALLPEAAARALTAATSPPTRCGARSSQRT